jgi:DNA-binding MarR family transcriptional regulator
MTSVPTQPDDADSPHEGKRVEVIEDLIDALRRFTVESDVFVDVFARRHHLGRSDLNAIMWISTGEQSGRPVTAGELAGRLGLGPPATTALVDRLEAAGHVRRTRDPQDRRKVTIVMQPPALKVASEFFVPLGRLMSRALEGSSPEEMRQATEIVRRLITAVTEARDEAAK